MTTKPKTTERDKLLNKVSAHLPSKHFTRLMQSNPAQWKQEQSPPLRATQQVLNQFGLVSGDAIAQELKKYANVALLDPGRRPDSVPWASMDVLLVAAEILPSDEPWRRAFLNLKGEADTLRTLMAEARKNGVPVVLWLIEEDASIGRFAHLFASADHILASPGQTPSDDLFAGVPATSVARPVDVKTFNPLHSQMRIRNQHERFIGFLVDGSHEIGMSMGPDRARTYFEPLFQYNWWLTDSSFDLRNADHKIHAIMRRRFMGSMRGADLAYPLKLAQAYFLPEQVFQSRPSYARHRAAQAAASKTLTFTDAGGTLPEHVIKAPDAQAVAGFAQWALTDRLAVEVAQHLAWRDILTSGTYYEFLETVLGVVGCETQLRHPRTPKVNIVVPTVRPDLIPYILENARRQVYENTTLNIVVNGTHLDSGTRALVDASGFAAVHTMPSHKTIGYCINYGMDQTDADYWAKFDDDDIYGAHYLSDMLLQRKYVDFGATGKGSLFTYFEEFDRMNIRRLANRDTQETFIGGGTILARPDAGPFPEDVRGYADTLYLAQVADQGHTIIAADPFNFVQVRRADPSSHTWTAGTQQLNLKGPQRQGLDLRHILI